MDVESLILTIVSIIIGLVTFYLSYRWTVTAKKERRKTACREVVSITMRTLVHNQIKPTPSLFEDLIRSKARECEVKRESLPSLSVFLEDIQSKILENEFIPHDTKENLLKEIGNLQNSVKKTQPEETAVESEIIGILGSSLFAFMSVAVLILFVVYLASEAFGAVELPPQSVLMTIGISVVSIIAAALGYWSVGRKESNGTEEKSQRVHGDTGV